MFVRRRCVSSQSYAEILFVSSPEITARCQGVNTAMCCMMPDTHTAGVCQLLYLVLLYRRWLRNLLLLLFSCCSCWTVPWITGLVVQSSGRRCSPFCRWPFCRYLALVGPKPCSFTYLFIWRKCDGIHITLPKKNDWLHFAKNKMIE